MEQEDCGSGSGMSGAAPCALEVELGDAVSLAGTVEGVVLMGEIESVMVMPSLIANKHGIRQPDRDEVARDLIQLATGAHSGTARVVPEKH